ncbi:Ig-like domain-containing protein [Kaarinaea lacus]
MKSYLWLVVVILSCATLAGCDKGDPTALKEAVKAADLNVSSITLEPADGTISTGYSYQFTAIGHRPDGSTVNVTNSVAWTSSNTAIATVNANGVVSTGADGVVTISAGLSSLSGSTSLTASSAALQSIAIFADTSTPNDLSVSACKNLQLKAIGTYADDPNPRDTIPITNHVTWSITAGNADINSEEGLLSTKSDGAIGVQASLDGIDGSQLVTANPDLTSISVSPSNASLAINATLQYMATGSYSDTSTADITENTNWTSSAPAVADFNNTETNGLISGLSTGTATVTAACGALLETGTTILTVSEDVVDVLLFEDTNGSETNPLNIAVGVTRQVILKAYLTDGTSRDVTEEAQWTIFNNTGDIVSVNNTTGNKGIVTALAVGTGVVQATYQRRDYLLIVNVTAP